MATTNFREAIEQFLREAHAKGVSDIHIVPGAPVVYRVGKDLVPATKVEMTAELSEKLSLALLTPEQQEELRRRGDFDVMFAFEECRYRVNVSYSTGVIGSVIRVLPDEVKTIMDLKLPNPVRVLAQRTKGLVLITGSTSQGKTTTMAAIIDEINSFERRHVITIEDPIEVLHRNKLGIVRQREVGRDTKDFASGLRAALRQDPNVIAIGEMRDYETVRIALTAAETGILVLSTLHVISIDKIMERLLSYAPPEEEGHMRHMLAGALQGIIHQELVPTLQGGKRVAMEILIANEAAKNIIRRRGTFFLRNVLDTGLRQGMVTMEQSIRELLSKGVISQETADSVMVNYQPQYEAAP